MNLRQIEVFRAVMLTGSTTDAARLLHVSQPGISRMIRHLETRLAVSLFERGHGRLHATPQAHALYAEIERVHRGVQHVRSVAENLRFGRHASLRVLASANTALQLVPRAIALVLQRHPECRITFEALPTREMVQLLATEEADIAIASAALDHPALRAREVGHWSLIGALPADHRLSRARSLRPAEIAADPVIAYSPEAPQSAVIDAWFGGPEPARREVVQVRSGYAACSMAAAGIGIALVDDLSARAHGTNGVAFVRMARAPRFPIYGVINANRPPGDIGESFLALVRQELTRIQKQAVPAGA